jgi:hypothetical protein
MAEDNGSQRTHEPNLREITAELDGFKEWVKGQFEAGVRFDDERDHRYEEGKIANKEAVSAAFAAAKEAVAEQKQAQSQYNDSHNGLLRKIDDQHKETLPRIEADGRFNRQDEKINEVKRDVQLLRDAVTLMSGRGLGAASTIAYIVSALSVLVMLLTIYLTLSKP